MKHHILFLLTVALLTACDNAHEQVALKQSGNVQAPTSVIASKKINSPASRSLTLEGIVAAWSSSTEQTVTLSESTPIEQVAIDKPVSPRQEKFFPGANLFKLFKKEQVNSLGERPGDKVGPRAGDKVGPRAGDMK